MSTPGEFDHVGRFASAEHFIEANGERHQLGGAGHAIGLRMVQPITHSGSALKVMILLFVWLRREVAWLKREVCYGNVYVASAVSLALVYACGIC